MAVKINREELVADLRGGVVEVHFIKADGSPRVMRATLCERFLPPQMQPADLQAAHEHRKTNPDVVAAWDLEMKGWRSFRLDTVTYLQGVHTE